MANTYIKKLIFILGLLILFNSTIFPRSIAQKQINQSTSVTFGFISSDSATYDSGKTIATKAIEDINNYMTENLYPYNFTIKAWDGRGESNFYVEDIQQMKANGISFIVGGGWSGEVQSSLSYLNSNNMILINTGAISPTLGVPNDNLFRLAPSDAYFGPALADIIWAHGIKSVIIFQIGDSWGDGITNLFVPAWIAKGGETAGDKIRYAYEVGNFANYLTVAEKEAATAVAKYDVNKVAVVLLGNPSGIMTAVKSYPTLCSVAWFNGGGTIIQSDTGAPKVFTILQESPKNSKYKELSILYPKSDLKLYDALWIYALSILKTGSTDVTTVKTILPSISENYVGTSGPYTLDKNGDQANILLDIWSGNLISGQYDLGRKQMYWGVGTKIGTSITCVSNPDSVLIQGATSFSGSITPVVANANVNLFITKSDGITETTKLMTNSSGAYSTTVSANSGGFWQVRATWDGNDAHFGATSQSAELYVQKHAPVLAMNIETIPIDNYPEVSFKISGQLTPLIVNTPIKIGLALSNRVNYTSVQTDSDGKFATNFTPNNSGNWEISAVWEGDSNYLPITTVKDISVIEPPKRSTVTLYIKDDSARIIGGANVISLSQPSSQKSLSGVVGSNGTLNFMQVRPGAYTFQAILDGYESSQVSVTADPGKVTEGTIILKKTAAAVGGVPGFPWESVVLGIVIGLTTLVILRKLRPHFVSSIILSR